MDRWPAAASICRSRTEKQKKNGVEPETRFAPFFTIQADEKEIY